jgi:hypothetical protein
MYCPQCRTEYREGFTECSDCHFPLLRGTAPRAPHNDLDPSLGRSAGDKDAIQLAVARGLLEDAGIPFDLLGQITRLVNDVDPFLQKHVCIQVPPTVRRKRKRSWRCCSNPSRKTMEARPGRMPETPCR